MEIHISKAPDIEFLIKTYGKYESIYCEIGFISQPDNERLTKKLSELYNECGCKAGSISMLIGIIVWILTSMMHVLPSMTGLKWYLELPIYLLLFGLFGKVAGISVSKIRLMLIMVRLKALKI
jgi:hypothetical protein